VNEESVDVAGVKISTEEQAMRLIEAQFSGVGPWSQKEDYTPAEGLERALNAAGPYLPVFVRAIAGHLEDDDLAMRTLAVVACDRAAAAIGPQFIALTLQLNPHLYAGVKPVGHPTNQPDLRWSLLTALGKAVGPEHGDAIRLLRASAREERGYWLLGALARVDLDWLLDNAASVVPKHALGGALRAMPDAARREALITAMGPWSKADRDEALAAPFWALLPDAAQLRRVLEAA
jgi:hypothetical protein